jgi:hypothetical protein
MIDDMKMHLASALFSMVIQRLRRTPVKSSIRASKLKGFMPDMPVIVRRALMA